MDTTRQCMRSSQALLRTFNSFPARDHTLPAFLVPALAQRPQQTSRFSTSSPDHSKIGRAPLSLPPGVTFRIQEAPQLQDHARVSRNQPGSTIEIEGPLGKMTMKVPAYVNIRSDDETRTHTVSIVDEEDKKQKAMWGAY